jgi:hypothetical protein
VSRVVAQVCRGVRWDMLALDDLVQVAESLAPAPLAAVCRLFLSGSVTSGGLPDLLLWRTGASGGGGGDAAPATAEQEQEEEATGDRWVRERVTQKAA